MVTLQSELVLPQARIELKTMPKNELVALFFHVFGFPESAPSDIKKWLVEEVQQRSRNGKITQKIALLMVRVMGDFSQKYEFRVTNNTKDAYVNELLLTSASDYFKSFFYRSHKEVLLDCPDELFDQLQTFFKVGSLPNFKQEDLIHLYVVAQKYQIDNLIDFCHDELAKLVEGISYHRLAKGQILLEIDHISDIFGIVFPSLPAKSTRLDLLSFVSFFKINGTALESPSKTLIDLVKSYKHVRKSISLSSTSISSAVPVLVHWDKEAAESIAELFVETQAAPSNHECFWSTTNLLIDLFSKFTSVTACHLTARNLNSDEIVKQIIQTMPLLEKLVVDAPLTVKALEIFPERLKSLSVSFPLIQFPETITKAHSLQRLYLGGLPELSTIDIDSLTRLPLTSLSLSNSLDQENLGRLLGFNSECSDQEAIGHQKDSQEKCEEQRSQPKEKEFLFPKRCNPGFFLEELSISAAQFTYMSYRLLANSKLKKLHLTQAGCLQDQHLKVLSSMSFLESFGIEDGTAITTQGLEFFIKATRLKKLVLNNCSQISLQFLTSPLEIRSVKLIRFSESLNFEVLGKIRYLRLRDNEAMKDEVIGDFKSYALKDIKIQQCPISLEGIHCLITRLPSLTKLVKENGSRYNAKIVFNQLEILKMGV